jgi:hypothetical protein
MRKQRGYSCELLSRGGEDQDKTSGVWDRDQHSQDTLCQHTLLQSQGPRDMVEAQPAQASPMCTRTVTVTLAQGSVARNNLRVISLHC